jgi:hypothetical protein
MQYVPTWETLEMHPTNCYDHQQSFKFTFVSTRESRNILCAYNQATSKQIELQILVLNI